MGTPHTWASWVATVASAGLAVLELGWATRALHMALAVAAVVLVLVTVACFGRLLRDNSFEARLGIAVVASLQLGMGLLAVTVGLPGQRPMRGDEMAISTIAVSAVLLAALVVDCRVRVSRAARSTTPHYAL